MTPSATTDLSPHAPWEPSMAENDWLIVDDLLKARAADKVQIPLLCFPRSERGITDYAKYTGRDLDRMIDHAVDHYIDLGLRPVSGLARFLSAIATKANSIRKKTVKVLQQWSYSWGSQTSHT